MHEEMITVKKLLITNYKIYNKNSCKAVRNDDFNDSNNFVHRLGGKILLKCISDIKFNANF